jgi:hypothetical protein
MFPKFDERIFSKCDEGGYAPSVIREDMTQV